MKNCEGNRGSFVTQFVFLTKNRFIFSYQPKGVSNRKKELQPILVIDNVNMRLFEHVKGCFCVGSG
jgi:hypothetical protein